MVGHTDTTVKVFEIVAGHTDTDVKVFEIVAGHTDTKVGVKGARKPWQARCPKSWQGTPTRRFKIVARHTATKVFEIVAGRRGGQGV